VAAALGKALKDKNGSIRKVAAWGLLQNKDYKEYHEAAKRFVPELAKLLGDKDAPVRQQAAIALVAFGSREKELLPVLIQALTERVDLGLLDGALGAVAAFGPKASEAVPGLAQILQDQKVDPKYREASVRAWGAIGSSDARKALSVALKDKDENVRRTAAEVVKALGR
jgi:HEAT repeat protein